MPVINSGVKRINQIRFLILRPCEGELELRQLGQLPVHVLVLADFLKGKVGLAQEDSLPHDAAVLDTDLQIRPIQALVGPLDKAEIELNEVRIDGYYILCKCLEQNRCAQ